MKELTSVAGQSRTEMTERKSVFIGSAAHVCTEDEAVAFVASVRKEFPDATHNVYAYTVCENGVSLSRFSDDGEPHGTAGLPVLDVLRKEGITDTAVVVTRYFGGILLGAGGLVRAYTASAKQAVDAAGRCVSRLCTCLAVRTSYADAKKLEYLLKTAEYVVTDGTEYTGEVVKKLTVLSEHAGELAGKISELTGGRAVCTVTGEKMAPLADFRTDRD